MSDVALPPIEGLRRFVRPREYGLHAADARNCMVARLTHMEAGYWLVWLDFATHCGASMLYRATLEEALAETVEWATTHRERLARAEHSGCPRRMDPAPLPRRAKRSARHRARL